MLKIRVKYFVRALRSAFLPASALPFVLGSLLARERFDLMNFSLGFFAVTFTHLSANLTNDWADSKSGLDWKDKKFYKFFGGSKLIQEGVFSENFYFIFLAAFALLAAVLISLLSWNLKDPSILFIYSAIMFFAWSYSARPLQLAYRRMGEAVIFILFGPALVMGGYFIQTRIFPDVKSLVVSLPVGFLITAVLFANEVPDYNQDTASGKLTWVSFLGERRSYIIYALLISCAFISIAAGIAKGFIGKTAILSFILLFPAIKAARILKGSSSKEGYIRSSKLTILVHNLVTVILILSVVL
ncbi:MAG: prenyltransferase [Candidatus Omnitrophica bacterium]|nr:prenyltransferase [Candidatus Omnitrophota bacterium]MDD5552889.1 prenyltransferase [Candidatus Omnitrophota bacterium]